MIKGIKVVFIADMQKSAHSFIKEGHKSCF